MLTVSSLEAGLTVLERRAAAAPVVSVVMAVSAWRRDGVTGQAIDSVLSQDFADLELIIVDDGSIDSLSERLRGYWQADERVTILRYERHCGLPAVRLNAGIVRAQGRYLHYRFEDDGLLAGGLGALVDGVAGRDDLLVFGACQVVGADETGAPAVLDVVSAADLDPRGTLTEASIARGAMLHSRRLIDRMGLFDPHIAVNDHYAFDFLRRMTRHADFLRVDAEVVSVHRGEDGWRNPVSPPSFRLAGLRMSLDRSLALGPDAIAGFDVGSSAWLHDKVDAFSFYSGPLARYLARHLTWDEQRQAGAVHFFPPENLTMGFLGHRTSRASIDFAYRQFARVHPDGITLYEPKLINRPDDYTNTADIVLQYRQTADPRVPARTFARQRGAPIVYATDDDFFHLHESPHGNADRFEPGGTIARTFRAQVRDADFIIVASDVLASIMSEHNPRVAVIETSYPISDVEAVPIDASDRPILTYAIVSGYLRGAEMAAIRDELVDFFKRNQDRTRLVVFASPSDEAAYADLLDGIAYEVWPRTTFDRYFDSLTRAGFDFIINPLEDGSVFFRAKSPVKYLEAAVAGAVLITSDVPIYEAITDGETGYKVPWEAGAWTAALDRSLAMSGDDRATILRNARRHVLSAFSTESRLLPFYAAHAAAMLHADLGSRSAPNGKARVLVEDRGGADGLADILKRFHFETVDAPGLEPTEDPVARGVDVLTGSGIALVHAASPLSPWVAAAEKAGIPCVASFDGADLLPPRGLWPTGSEPDVLLARTPTALARANATGFAPVFRQVEPLVAGIAPPTRAARPAGASLRIAVAAGPGRAELGAALAAKAVAGLGEGGGPVELLLPFDEGEGRAWGQRWARWSNGVTLRFVGRPDGAPERETFQDIDMLLAFGGGVSVYRAALAALIEGTIVIGIESNDVADIVADGFNGFLAGAATARDIADAVVAARALPADALAKVRAQGVATGYAMGHEDPAAANLLYCYRLAVDACNARLGREARRAGLPAAPEHDIAVTVRAGGSVRFLGFRSGDPSGPQVLAAAYPPDWTSEAVDRRYNAMRAGGVVTGTARFRVAADDLEIGFASSRATPVNLVIDGASIDIKVGKTAWWRIGSGDVAISQEPEQDEPQEVEP